jgi:S-ribosylhomocysteine lyase
MLLNMELKRITSFEVDHTKLDRGLYISRIDGDITTYDIRMKKPNAHAYLENDAIHTIEHLFATFVRNTELSKNIIYFGPMGCRTGFYFITRGIDAEKVISLTKQAFEFIAGFKGDIPGNSAEECGNYKEHSIQKAQQEVENFLPVLENYNVSMLKYPVV